MEYTYEIARISAKHRFMRVIYRSDGREDMHRNYHPTTFTSEAIAVLIEAGAPAVFAEWGAQEAAPTVDEEVLGVGIAKIATYTKPVMARRNGPKIRRIRMVSPLKSQARLG